MTTAIGPVLVFAPATFRSLSALPAVTRPPRSRPAARSSKGAPRPPAALRPCRGNRRRPRFAAGAPEGISAGPRAGRRSHHAEGPADQAAAFTGSLAGGRALFDIAGARPRPIPFYGELGSMNPVVVTPEAVARRGKDIAAGYVGSFTIGAGQFCTKPGLLFVPAVTGWSPRWCRRPRASARSRS